jgi:phosphoenolpyruvate synthase/pyruvate phosphate dikinase
VSVLTLEEAAGLPTAVIGGKAKGLARLAALELPVPPARVLDTSVHEAFLSTGTVGSDVAAAAAEAATELGWPVAVRSSAADEDVADKSAAGQYESVMGVRSGGELMTAIERCYHAADSTRARAYRGDSQAGVALVLQREIAAQRAGVAFSVDPVSGSPADVVIEAVFGHGEGLVSGELDPDRFRVARDDGRVRARRAEKRRTADGGGRLGAIPSERRWGRVLRDDEARCVADLVVKAERGFGSPVDVEFCWAGPELWLVQCRPITTLRVAA